MTSGSLVAVTNVSKCDPIRIKNANIWEKIDDDIMSNNLRGWVSSFHDLTVSGISFKG